MHEYSNNYDPLTADGPGCGLDHVPSYWADTAPQGISDDGPLQEDVDVDVAIIGGGYTGLSTAYHLARQHDIKAVVLEANRAGWGCSGRNGGFVRPKITRAGYGKIIKTYGIDQARNLFAQERDAYTRLKALIEDENIDCEAQPEGWFQYAHRPRTIEKLQAHRTLMHDKFGYAMEYWDAGKVAERCFNSAEAHGALYASAGFGLHPMKLAHGLLQSARRYGAKVYSGSPVIRWDKATGRHRLHTPQGIVTAKRVVVGTNGYTGERLNSRFRARTMPVLSIVGVTRVLTPNELEAVNYRTTAIGIDTRSVLFFYRKLPDNRILIGGRGPIQQSSTEMAIWNTKLLSTLKLKFPTLGDVDFDYFWGGWVCLTSDGVPHVSQAEDDPSVVYAMGYNGSGVTSSIYSGHLLANLLNCRNIISPIINRPIPKFPLAAFRRAGQRGYFMLHGFLDNRK